ncbi:MAG: diaminobutyrate acetyltransferase [Acidobacteria bacterium]|nr:diaminobutyrate acetyltransferase [Acidobacteriota bacterium]
MPNEATITSGTESGTDRSNRARAQEVVIKAPTADDAADVHALIAACPPLDTNSRYANLIQCTHFADTCAVARLDGKVAGWVSGHHPPGRGDTYFLWQVAVSPAARGSGLPLRMIRQILSRAGQSRVRFIETSITSANEASWALFRSVADKLAAPIADRPWFEKSRHFAGQHDTEHLVTIGPFERVKATT